MKKQTPLPVSGVVLYHLYVEQGMSIENIGKMFGAAYQTVKQWLTNCQIRLRGRGRPPVAYLKRTAHRNLGMWAILGQAYAARVEHEGKVYRKPTLAGLMKALSTLTPREATAIALYFGLLRKPPLTYQAIARYLGVNRSRAEQLVRNGIIKLRRKRRYEHIYSMRVVIGGGDMNDK